jgi:ribose transport system substrate-binding protein
MTIKIQRRQILGAGLTGFAMVASRLHSARAEDKKKLRIALSNSYIGNQWRIEMENVFKAALQMEPYKSEVEGSWYNSGNDSSKQSQQLSNLIAEGVDAILINAASPTALNGIINQGASHGVLMVAFDNTVTTSSAVNVNDSNYDMGKVMAEWLAKNLDGKGNVIMVTGVAGTEGDLNRNKGADDVWAKNPGIHVVNRYTGMWDSSTAERNTAALLPSLPQVDGVWCQGGTDGVLNAFVAANRPLPKVAGGPENGFRKYMIGFQGHKLDGISTGQPPFISVVALEVARQILQGKRPKKDVALPLAVATSEMLKAGESVFPDQPDGFFANFTDTGDDAIVKLCLNAALDGSPCGPALAVNLPPA